MSLDRPNILITRLSHIGDCILTVPVLNALRDHFPHAHLAWVVERPSSILLEGHASLDELIVVPRKWLKSPKTVWQLRRKLRRRNFDITIDPQSLTKSAIIGRLAAARRRIGFDGEDGRELSKLLNNELVQRTGPHMVDRSLELLKPLGVERPRVRFDLPLNDEAEKLAAQVQAHLGNRGQFALVNPGAGWPSKIWPAAHHAAVTRHIGQEWSMPSIVVWAGDDERRMADQIVAESQGHAKLAPPTTLHELASLCGRAALFVGSDTGPLHIAAAKGTSCVGLYGSTLPEICGPYGENHISVQEYYQAGNCRERRRGPNTAMRAISPQRVCAACDEILSRDDASPAIEAIAKERIVAAN